MAKLEAGLEGKEKVLAWPHADQQQGGLLNVTTRYIFEDSNTRSSAAHSAISARRLLRAFELADFEQRLERLEQRNELKKQAE